MKIPLSNRLRKRLHVEVAMLQDELAGIVYEAEEKAVLHGGTAIWRCYEGNRFSEGLDFYFPSFEGLGKLREKIEGRGLLVSKYKETGNALYAKISDKGVEVRLEVLKKKEKGAVVRKYEKADGSFMDVFTLSAKGLILEKIDAYIGRRLVRDFYDVYHLLKYAEGAGEIAGKIRLLLEKATPPIDEKNLKALVYQGAIPSYGQMLEYVKGFSK